MWCMHGVTDPLPLFCWGFKTLPCCGSVLRLPTGGDTATGTNKKVCSTQKHPVAPAVKEAYDRD